MRIVFRADASTQMGSGHIMRCMCLAEALQKHQAQIWFIVRHITDYLEQILRDKGFQVILLPDQNSQTDDLFHSEWLGVSQIDDALATCKVLQHLEKPVDWLIVDHYAIDHRWERILKPLVDKVLVIDDLADRIHDCDILLDQNQYLNLSSRYKNKVHEDTQLLLGSRYALLRNEFRVARQQKKQEFNPQVRKILIFFGGMDKENYTGKLLNSLEHDQLSQQLKFVVVIGAQHPDLNHIKKLCEQFDYELHINSTKMAELMLQADIAIGAGGSSSWERCCVGLPSLAFAIARNQIQLTEDAALQGLIDSPNIDWNNPESIRQIVMGFIHNPLARQRIFHTAFNAVDGKGTQRVLRTLGVRSLSIRRATFEDSQSLWQWRNHDSIRLVSRNTDLIALDSHEQWFRNILQSLDRVMLIAEHNHLPVGVIRFDFEETCAEISIYCVPNEQGAGFSIDMLQEAEKFLFQHYSNITEIKAVVLADNWASHHLFLNAGYQRNSTTYLKKLVRHS